jgi:V8-like Glu-specific endopeptidase
MWTDADLIEIIHESPAVANEALQAIRRGDGKPADLDALNASAEAVGLDGAVLCLTVLRNNNLIDSFVQALLARGVEVDTEVAENGRIDIEGMADFLQRAKTFRCRVEVDNTFKGTGCLVGPGLVLTAWHVVRTKGPGKEQNPEPKVSVKLADGNTYPAGVPPSYASECGDKEWQNEAPRADADVLNRHDVALLALRTPAARHLGFARLPEELPRVVSRSKLYLLDFPRGEDEQLGEGTIWKIRKVTARLRHDIKTAEGSSGGACFNSKYQLLGLHQGRQTREQNGQQPDPELSDGRLVPLSLFAADIAELISKDIAPLELWHLDGENSQLVIGRDSFVAAVAAAGQENTRVRGVRVKRRNVSSGDETGLGFSHRILTELLLRRGGEQLAVRIPLDEPVSDLVSDIAERVRLAGFAMNPIRSPGGVEPGQAAAEAAAREQAFRLAVAVNQAATKAGRLIWFFVDNPSVPLSEQARLHLEGFVASCLVQPRIRLVIAGLETLPLAGLEFSSPAAARDERTTEDGSSAGLVVDYVGSFTGQDVLNCLTGAAEDLTGESDPQRIKAETDLALGNLANVSGVYTDSALITVVTRLQPYLQELRDRAEDNS